MCLRPALQWQKERKKEENQRRVECLGSTEPRCSIKHIRTITHTLSSLSPSTAASLKEDPAEEYDGHWPRLLRPPPSSHLHNPSLSIYLFELMGYCATYSKLLTLQVPFTGTNTSCFQEILPSLLLVCPFSCMVVHQDLELNNGPNSVFMLSRQQTLVMIMRDNRMSNASNWPNYSSIL